MEKTINMCKTNGYMAMINIPVWMFLSSYEKLREKLFSLNTLSSMVHLGRGVFGSDFGTTSFIFTKHISGGFKGSYRRLFEKQGAVDSVETKEKWFFEGKGSFNANQADFSKIPGMPVAYWVSKAVYNAFLNFPNLYSIAPTKMGMTTGDNNKFLRFWYEVNKQKVGENYPFYNKGTEFRRWFGGIVNVIKWIDNGFEVRHFKGSTIRNDDYYFKKGITWGLITSATSSFRSTENYECVYGDAGPGCFPKPEDFYYTLAMLNSKPVDLFLNIMNPTINLSSGVTAQIPAEVEKDSFNTVSCLSKENVDLSRRDWDSFETSWDFKTHPLIKPVPLISESFAQWSDECEKRFTRLKSNEEELNRIFIDIYSFQDELTPEVEEKDVTVRRADLTRDIKSLVSYAVGCMFGRYSLDVEGLAYAGGEWDGSKYKTFIPDPDNCIPVTDEEYFRDDIVVRFVDFIRTVYGADTLEENLTFIADALGTRGNTSRERIRNYFLNDFIKDHIKMYQKRPIYWMFDSGKQNGFRALVYMHRWNADTTGNVRVEYLHKLQRIYENEIRQAQDVAETGSGREVSAAQKRIEKLTKQLKETHDFDEKIAHLALSRIDIDLDDGVKVNYEKVQTGDDGKKIEVLTKI